jgi:hypothetical protein
MEFGVFYDWAGFDRGTDLSALCGNKISCH